jgi:dienelactone hydrolase
MGGRVGDTKVLEGFEVTPFEALGASRDVYRLGEGPAVLVLSEAPGITPRVTAFARRVASRGLTATMPHLFGDDGRAPTSGYLFKTISQVCISREFTLLATGRSSPVIEWLRALARDEHRRCGGPGVGVVGMCLTGGFALAMLADAPVIAPVLAQPSLPASFGTRRASDLGCSAAELAIARQRVSEGVSVLGLRFTNDPAVKSARFDSLRRELGDGFIAIELDSSAGNPYGHRKGAHSTLTEDLVDREGSPTMAALQSVLDFLASRLGVRAPS